MYNFIQTMVLPPALPMAIMAIGLIATRWRPAIGRRAVWLGLTLLYVLSTPVAGTLLIRAIEIVPTAAGPDFTGAGAIVVLSAGSEADSVEYGGETVDRDSLVRLRYAAALHRRTGLPILATGGTTPWTVGPLAVAMKATLEADFGVPVRWVEDRATTTAENASFSAELLKREGIRKIVLVTEAYHMRRSRAVFEARGLVVAPGPTITRGGLTWGVGVFYPQSRALDDSHAALHEMVGMIWYRLRGHY